MSEEAATPSSRKALFESLIREGLVKTLPCFCRGKVFPCIPVNPCCRNILDLFPLPQCASLETGLVESIDFDALGLCGRGQDSMKSQRLACVLADWLRGSGSATTSSDSSKIAQEREGNVETSTAFKTWSKGTCQTWSALLPPRACPPWPDESLTFTSTPLVDGSILHALVDRGLLGASGRCCYHRKREIWTSRTPWLRWWPSCSRCLEWETCGRLQSWRHGLSMCRIMEGSREQVPSQDQPSRHGTAFPGGPRGFVHEDVSVTHVSLHFDGFIKREDPGPNVDFRESVERHVLDKTGLRVSLAYKEHLSWLERVMRHEVVGEGVALCDADAQFWLHPARTVRVHVFKTHGRKGRGSRSMGTLRGTCVA